MDDKQILRNQIKVDEENLREDINSGFRNDQEAFEKETDRIQAKKRKLLEMEYPMKSVCCDARLIDRVQCENCGADGRRFERQECSEDYPLGKMIEPYDIEREKELAH